VVVLGVVQVLLELLVVLVVVAVVEHLVVLQDY
jgi:hypothetical protein